MTLIWTSKSCYNVNKQNIQHEKLLIPHRLRNTDAFALSTYIHISEGGRIDGVDGCTVLLISHLTHPLLVFARICTNFSQEEPTNNDNFQVKQSLRFSEPATWGEHMHICMDIFWWGIEGEFCWYKFTYVFCSIHTLAHLFVVLYPYSLFNIVQIYISDYLQKKVYPLHSKGILPIYDALFLT